MDKEEADERIKEIVDLLTIGMRTNENIADAYMKLFFFQCDWIRAFDITIKEVH